MDERIRTKEGVSVMSNNGAEEEEPWFTIGELSPHPRWADA